MPKENLNFKQVDKMYNLAFDTTAAGCSIGLFQDRKKIGSYQKKMDFGQAEVLIPEIKNLMENAKISFGDLELLSVCVGPGSFTGVRAGIAAARAFGVACPNLKLAGVSAFDAYIPAFHPDELATINVVLIETKREDYYVQLFDKNLRKMDEPQVMSYDDIITLLRGQKVSFIGDGTERFLNKPSGLSLHAINNSSTIAIEDLALCGLEQLQNRRLDFPKPLYLRAPDVSRPKGCAA